MQVKNRCGLLLGDVLDKAVRGGRLSREEITALLELRSEEDTSQLFEAARVLRNKNFGKKIFMYGFVYFSTWCRNQCSFCLYRRPNVIELRYRKGNSEIIKTSVDLAESGVHLIDLTMGEDPGFYNKAGGFKPLVELVKRVKEETNLPVMISPGVATKEALGDLAEAGADWYACYQETHNRELFERLRPGQSYDERLNIKYYAKELGMLIEEGIMTGVGDTIADVADSIENMEQEGAHQVRVMSFVPQPGTPMENWPSPPRIRELVTIAVFRLMFPDRLIPASLDVDGIAGLKDRLNAGANVVTSIIPPDKGLAGVSQSYLDINEGFRTTRGVLPVLDELGLEPATAEEYMAWVNVQKEGL